MHMMNGTQAAEAPVRIVLRTRAPEHMSPEEIDDFISGHDWRFARTMAHMPHSYVVKKNCRSPIEFERFVMHIRRNGYRQKFGRAYYTYFDWPIDGVTHQFWTMGFPSRRPSSSTGQ